MAIILSTGSYCPVHRMHIETFYLCKKALEEQYGIHVVGAFISPSHKSYVASKLQEDFIETETRLKLCEISIEQAEKEHLDVSPFLSVDAWESVECDGFVDFPEVSISLNEFIKQEFPQTPIKLIYLCGSDHINKCRYVLSFPKKLQIGVGILQRPSHSQLSNIGKGEKDIYHIETTMQEECSSTLVRKRAKQGESIQDLVCSDVENFMRNHHIYYQ
ncbi:predicted protein [Naegleria gruberi]|uniref:Predicted protein n=1 Tax=Naegleria gruberi TaxID=5762 RepID=D2V6C3_NAEGR|nr:uncharacterized protein NAEGRDRAFT_64385 [Naegleria gruberi]EFC47546.1 predicted protein [Naegleria gruberi]|eukprot:XP_002680290.1 predicted protein [Naegleria gruberi strain NEG-M]